MSRADLSQLLDGLQLGLEGLLSCIEAQPLPESPVLDAAWGEVHRSFECVRHRLEALDGASAEREAALERMQHCLRLHAVATGVLVRRREELVAVRAACGEARNRIQRLRGDASGGSCDVRA